MAQESQNAKDDDCVTTSKDDKKGLGNSEIMVDVIIRSSQQTFSIKALSQLSYFEARLSDRWLKSLSGTSNEIVIFGTNDKNDSTFNYNQIQFQFDCNDLKLLLKCFETSNIPGNLYLKLNELESLLYCHDYFNPQSNKSKSFVIDETVLFNYFRHRVPSLDKAERDEFLSNCTNTTLHNALIKLSDHYKSLIDQSNKELFVHVMSWKKVRNSSKTDPNYVYNFITSLLNNLSLDSQRATALFETQFSPVTYCSVDNTCKEKAKMIDMLKSRSSVQGVLDNLSKCYILYIGILDFKDTYPTIDQMMKNKNRNHNNVNDNNNHICVDEKENSSQQFAPRSILCDLWKLCENGRYLSEDAFLAIDDMIAGLFDPRLRSCRVKGIISTDDEHLPKHARNFNPDVRYDQHQVKFIKMILSRLLQQMMMKKLTTDDVRLRKTRYINVCSLAQAIIMICARCDVPLPFARSCYVDVAEHLTLKESEELVTLMCELTDKYFPRSFMCNLTLTSLELVKQSIDNWIILFQNALLRCGKKYVIREMNKWFPILHDRPRKWLKTAADRVKKAHGYKSASKENEDSKINVNNDDSDDSDHDKDYFNDEMIEAIVELKFDWESQTAEWIINELIRNTDQCVDFGVYLSNYLIFGQENGNKHEISKAFPSVYIDFMKKHCDITWNLTDNK